jgi:hypothetical protein
MFCDGLRSCIGWTLGGFSPIVLRPSKACADKWTVIFELKVILAMLVRSLGFRDAAAVVDGKGGCHCYMLSLRESTAWKFFGNESVVVPLALPVHKTVTAV